MPFQLSLYRAAEGLGPLHTWDREHRQPLGTRSELRAAIAQLLPELQWSHHDALCFASIPDADGLGTVEVSLFGEPGETLLDFRVYALPPQVRTLMRGLNLNYCYAEESGELYDPFAAGDRWPDTHRHL